MCIVSTYTTAFASGGYLLQLGKQAQRTVTLPFSMSVLRWDFFHPGILVSQMKGDKKGLSPQE